MSALKKLIDVQLHRAIIAVGYIVIMAFPDQARSDSESIKSQLQKYVVEIRSTYTGATRLGVGVVSDSFTSDGVSYTGILCPASTVRYSEKVLVLFNGKQYEGKVVHSDKTLNVARISIFGVALSPAPRLKDGESIGQRKVHVIGASGMLDATTASGNVKKVDTYSGIPFIYTSAALAEGANAAFMIDDAGNFLGIGGLHVKDGTSELNVGVDVQTIEKAVDASIQEDTLRGWAEGHETKYSTKDRALIAYEHLLGRWLLGKSPNESNSRYLEVEKASESAWKVEPNDIKAVNAANAKAGMVYESVLEQFLAEQNTTPLVAGKTTKLVCLMADSKGGNRSDFNVDIDYRNQLANGWKAEINDGEVRWKYPADKKYEGTLNRYTGSLRLAVDGGGVLLVGPCEKAEVRKF